MARASSSLRRQELSMLGSFLLVITSFWILKPLRKALFVQHYDRVGLSLGGLQLPAASAELCAKLLQVLLAMLLALGFARLARSHRRHTLVTIVGAGFALAFAALAALPDAEHAASAIYVWTLYSIGDLYSTLLVAALFACLNDLATPASARRSYGLVGLGAVLGGVLGSQVVSLFLDALSLRAWLVSCAALTLAAVALVRSTAGAPSSAASAVAGAMAAGDSAGASDSAHADAPLQPSQASTYLIWLALLVGLYEILSTLLDYQFTATLARTLDGAAIGRQMGRAFALMNGTALMLQLFFTTPLLEKRGARTALLCLPVTLLCASLGMVVFPVVPMASLVPALDSGFAYSVHQSAKEGLYVPLPARAKYGAKAFIDVFVMRTAKAFAVLCALGVTTAAGDVLGLRWLALTSLALCVPFAWCALQLGRRNEALTRASSLAVRGAVVP